MRKFLREVAVFTLILTFLVTSFMPAYAAYPDDQCYVNGKMYNNLVEYFVANSGRFTVGTTYGNLTNPNDDFKKLLYGHPSPGTSFTTIKVDGSNYYFTAGSVNPKESDLSTSATQIINGILINQELKIVSNSNSGKADTVQIKYTVNNNDTSAHSIGTRIMMDTMLGYNDAAPFRIPGYGAVTTELELTGDNIPDYWQAFDSLTNPSVIAQGTLLRTDNKPDKVQFTNWGRVHSTMWDYTVRTGSANNNSAVSIYWNPTQLQPGESKTYVTYYGLSEFIQDLRPPIGLTLNRVPTIDATTNGYHPNPVKISGFVTNLGSAAAENVKLRINLPDGLIVEDEDINISTLSVNETKDFYWDVVLPEFPDETLLSYSVEVTADNAERKTLFNSFTVPETKASELIDYCNGAKYSIGAERYLTGEGIAIQDPVDSATGNFIFSNTDITVNGYNPISFTRYYNSVDIWQSILGKSWHADYDIKLKRVSEQLVSITFNDGRVEEFTKTSDDTFRPMPGKYGIVEYVENGYILTQKDKTKYTFDLSGDLLSIQNLSGNTTDLNYESGRLSSVSNDCGSLKFEYTGNLLSKITDNTGKFVEYGYTGDNLTSFIDVDGNKTSYTYDEKNRLTVVLDPLGNAKVTNEYDNKNRVLNQIMADGTTNSMVYDETARTTTLTDRNGAQIVYKWDEQYRIYETVYINGNEKAVYNSDGQKTSFIDKNGNVFKYEYDSNGNILKEINPLGEIAEYTYDSNNRITLAKMPDGSSYLYSYDAKGNLISAKDPLNNEISIEYNEKGLPTKMILPDGISTALEYDNRGNVISATEPMGNTTNYEYDLQNRVIKITKALGNEISYEYTANGKVKKIINSDETTIETKYDSRGLVVEEKDASGNVIKNNYDSMGHLIETTDALGNSTKYDLDSMWNIAKVTLPNAAEIKYNYNPANLLTSMTDPLNNTINFEYDSNGNVIKETDFNGNQTIYTYDSLNRLEQITDANNNTTKYQYDSKGNIVKVLDALNQAAEYKYDAAGHLIQTTDVLGNITKYSYNSMGYVETITDAKGSIIEYTYDSNGNVKKITYPDNTKTAFEYDKNGNVIKTIDAKGSVTKYQYDNMDRLTALYNALNGKRTVKYTPSNQVSEVIDENGNKTQYKYDAMNRLVEVVDAKNNSTKYVYDKVGNLTEVHRYGGITQEVKDSMTKVGVAESVYQPQNIQAITKYEYNLNGLLTKEINPGGKVTVYDYDKNGNIISKTDSDEYTTQFKYDVLDNVIKVKYNDDKEENYEYNSLGYLTKLQDWLGTTTFEVDALGQILKVNDYMNKTIEYSWSPTGEKLSMKYPDGSLVKYNYDSMGRLTKVTDADKLSTTYKYDILGNLTEKFLPNGVKTEYVYDSLSRIINMNNMDNKGKIMDAYTYVYDAVGNKTEINRTLNGGKAPTSIFDEVEGKSIYAYDELNQLISVSKPNNTMDKYFYDNLGNRVRQEYWTKDRILQAADYSYDIEGRLVQIAGSNRLDYKGKDIPDTLDFEYDNRGNLLNIIFDNKVISQYSFDSKNKMESAVNYLGDETSFQYDGLGRRVELKVERNEFNQKISFGDLKIKIDNKGEANGNDKYSICQKWFGNYLGFDLNKDKSVLTKQSFVMDITSPYNDILTTHNDDGTSQRYTYGHDIISSEHYSSQGKKSVVEKLYYLQDELGSTIGLVDNKGKYVERYSYDEFGRPIKSDSSQGIKNANNPFGFTGYQYDESTGLYFAQARYYMPEVGRFVSRDAYAGNITESLSLNLYTYCLNNSLTYYDPSGNIYLIAWSYGKKDVKEFEKYYNDNLATNKKLTVDESTDDWDNDIFEEFTKRSSFARAAYSQRKRLIESGVDECDIDIQRIDNNEDLIKTWDYWSKYDLVEGVDIYSHGSVSGPEVYQGTEFRFWENAVKLNYGSTLRNRVFNGKNTGYVSSPYVVFYGCNTGEGQTTQIFANNQNVTTYAQIGTSNFSTSPSTRFPWEKISTHSTELDIYLRSYEKGFIWNPDGLGRSFLPER